VFFTSGSALYKMSADALAGRALVDRLIEMGGAGAAPVATSNVYIRRMSASTMVLPPHMEERRRASNGGGAEEWEPPQPPSSSANSSDGNASGKGSPFVSRWRSKPGSNGKSKGKVGGDRGSTEHVRHVQPVGAAIYLPK
jgi:hypothetical protein